MRTRSRSRPPIADPGWLFLAAGLLLMASGVLIPAYRDLDRALWRRDRVLETELHRLGRITRYETYIEAVRERNPRVVRELASMQLGLVPDDSHVLLLAGTAEPGDATVFSALEPPPIELPERTEPDTTLGRLATGERSRLWLFAASALLVLLGLLPPSESRRARPKRSTRRTRHEDDGPDEPRAADSIAETKPQRTRDAGHQRPDTRESGPTRRRSVA